MRGAHHIRIVLLLAPLGLSACTLPSERPIKRTPRTTRPPPDIDTGLRLPTSPNDTPPGDSALPGDPADPMEDVGDTPADARYLPTPSPAWTVSDTIDPAGDADWYAVDLEAGDTIWIAALAALRTPPSPLAPRLEVRAESGEVLHLTRGMPLSLAEQDTAIAFEAPTAGTYFIGVDAADPSTATLDHAPEIGGPEYAYSLRLEQAPPFESEPHNDSPEAMSSWLEFDGNYAYLGDPFIAGWPLFSFRADSAADRDVWPWVVRGETEDGAPADWELWSFSPWPGCAPSSTWTITSDHPSHTWLGAGHTRTLVADPLYQLARNGLPVLPDVGLLVAAPPGTLWLTVDHDPDSPVVGSACTGILGGWATDDIPRVDDLPMADGSHVLSPTPVSTDHTTALAWGHIESGQTLHFALPASTSRSQTHILLQATQIGHPVDLTLVLSDPIDPDTVITDNPISGGSDPEAWNWSSTATDTLRFSLHAAEGSGAFFLQVHQTAAPLP